MAKYLKLYSQHSQYVEPTLTPSVAYCMKENEVHYSKYVEEQEEQIQWVYDNTINSLQQGGFTVNTTGQTNRGLILRYAENGGEDFDDYFRDGTLYEPTRGITANEWKARNCAPVRATENTVINVTVTQPSGNTMYYAVHIQGSKDGSYVRLYDSGWQSTSNSYVVGDYATGYDFYYFQLVCAKNDRGTGSSAQMTIADMQNVQVSVSTNGSSQQFQNYTISNLLLNGDNLCTSSQLEPNDVDRLVDCYSTYGMTWPGGLAVNNYEIMIAFNYGYLYSLQQAVNDPQGNYYGYSKAPYKLQTSGQNNHANSLSYYAFNYTTGVRVVVVGECYGSKRCFVERITGLSQSTSTLLSTITYSGTAFNTDWDWDWTYDSGADKLYAIGYSGTKRWPTYVSPSTSDVRIVVLEFNMPDVSISSHTLTDSDVLHTYTFDGVGRERQDISINNGIMFYLYSDKTENSSAMTGGTVDGRVLIADLTSQTELNDIDLSSIALEPEGCCYYYGELWVSFHQYAHNTGDYYIYKITFS